MKLIFRSRDLGKIQTETVPAGPCGSQPCLTCSVATSISSEGIMGIIVWIILGIIVTILIGIAGALIGGYISTRMGYGAVDGIDLRSILIAVGGAIILLFLFRLIRRGA